MRSQSTTPALAAVAALLVLTLTGCGAGSTTDATAPRAAPSSATAEVPEEAEPVLSRHGLDGMDTVEIIDHLDRLGGADRPADLMASVRPDVLVLSSAEDETEVDLDIPADRFYLSVAPYVDQTHDCFHHSLTTCAGELSGEEVRVEILDTTNDEVLVDETRTTFDNGFTGFWLPRDVEGVLRVTYDGKAGEVAFGTYDDSATCLTTLQLA